MIQISPQVQSSEAHTGAEAAQRPQGKAGGPLGVFAKLLQGLLGKNKTLQGAGLDQGAEGSQTDGLQAEGSQTGSLRAKGLRVKGGRAAGLETAEAGEEEGAGKAASRKALKSLAAAESGQDPAAILAASSLGKLQSENLQENALYQLEETFDRPLAEAEEAAVAFSGGDLSIGADDSQLSWTVDPALIEDVLKAWEEENQNQDTGSGLKNGGTALGDMESLFLDGEEAPGRNFSRQISMDRSSKDDAGSSKSAAVKARDKRRERLVLDVQDFRTGPNLWKEPVQELKTGGGTITPAGREIILTVDLSSERSAPQERAAAGVTPGRSFEDLLSRELQQGLGENIIRQASVILKDGGEGTIRLSLRPESLGTVKIRLEMAENKISGRIIVESNEALRAFEQQISSLEQAFKDSGFDGANLETALASGQDQNGTNQRWGGEESKPFFSERLAASSYSALTETTEGIESGALAQIDMLV